uniref:Uncharacterized protein n=1 Tax=Chrysotila carterae TaxID=13221 RepID=A0A7S4C5R4_CHRCT|mmetsp:Transcript_42874/g.93948  ORF Transcript_42874/g.93948 Transcript_42874/m.93948 type:complete len:275 (+) Transcript_42874:319-1143(+)
MQPLSIIAVTATTGAVIWVVSKIFSQLRVVKAQKKVLQADNALVRRLLARGLLPAFAIPKIDHNGLTSLRGQNGIKHVFVAEYAGGLEVTVVFWDEDRPNPVTDIFYDMFRGLIFGRWEDVETFFVLLDDAGVPSEIEFAGTYCGDSKFWARVPQHLSARLKLSEFDSVALTVGLAPCRAPLVWINTWNHAFGEKNNNTEMEMMYCLPRSDAVDKVVPPQLSSADAATVASALWPYDVSVGDRNQVDALYRGLVTTFCKTHSKELKARLGDRVM